MKIEDAIDSCARSSICGRTVPVLALQMLIDAAREKQERDKGCEYCKEREPLMSELGDLQVDDSDGTLWFTVQQAADDIYEDHTDILYCPKCGRKLVQE